MWELRRHRGRWPSGRAIGSIFLFGLASSVLIACGGGSDESAPTAKADTAPPPLTRRALIARADAICAASRHKLARITREHFRFTRFRDPSEELPSVEYSRHVLGIAKSSVEGLEALTPPPALRSDYEAYLKAEREVEDLARQALKASDKDNGGAYYKARKTRDAGEPERYDLARAVGLKRCSPNPF